MGEIRRIPSIVTHEIANGGVCDGSLPDGTDSEETLYRGRYRIWTACTKAGKLELPDVFQGGFVVYRVSAVSTGPTAFNVYLLDPDGFAFPVGGIASGTGFVDFGSKPLVVPPTFACVAKLTGAAITADSRVMFGLAERWGQPTFSQEKDLGREERPPSMERA